MNRTSLQTLCDSLGKKTANGEYVLSEDALECLEAIERELIFENHASKNVRIGLAEGQLIKTHLIPFLVSADLSLYRGEIQVVIRLLVNLTLPLECILLTTPSGLCQHATAKASHQFCGSQNRTKLLQNYLFEAKRSFVEQHRSTASIIHLMRSALNCEPPAEYSPNSTTGQPDQTSTQSRDFKITELALLNNCLLLLRNLLHVPDPIDLQDFTHCDSITVRNQEVQTEDSCFRASCDHDIRGGVKLPHGTADEDLKDEWQKLYKKLLWNLMLQGLDSVLLLMMNSKYRDMWTAAMVQLITLLYKDQRVSRLETLLSFTGSACESSEDDIESDHASSKFHSGSASLLSDSSSSKECREKKEGSSSSSKSDSGYPKSSDTASLSESVFKGDGDQSKNEDLLLESEVRKEPIIIEGEAFHAPIMDKNSCNSSPEHGGCREKDGGTPEGIDSSDSLSASVDEGEGSEIKSSGKEEKDVQAEQTSGISNGSSEEEPQARCTHKVMKHQRSARVESDSSDESNELGKQRNTVRPHHPPSGIRKPKNTTNCYTGSGAKCVRCSPSVCMEAALNAAFSEMAINKAGRAIKVSIAAPWDRKKTYGSKKAPITLNDSSPVDEDIAVLLADLTLKFLHNSFHSLVEDLHRQLLMRRTITLDQSHFLWLLSFFMRLSVSLNLDFSHIKPLLTADMFAFLTFQGIEMNEQLELLTQQKHFFSGGGSENGTSVGGSSSKRSSPSLTQTGTGVIPCSGWANSTINVVVRKMHLLVTAIRELLSALETYSCRLISTEDKDYLRQLRRTLAQMTDMRQLFLLLIRSYSPLIHSKQFLLEVVITNHSLLLLFEPIYLDGDFDMPAHLKQFATPKVMEQFGKLLEDFKSNSEFINDVIFTMMHHVAGDLKAPETLFHPIILKKFTEIAAQQDLIKDQWSDLMEYVMNRFVKAAQRQPAACLRQMFGEHWDYQDTDSTDSDSQDIDNLTAKAVRLNLNDATESSTASSSCSESSSSVDLLNLPPNQDQLYWLYLQFEQTSDPVGCIVDAFIDEHQIILDRKDVLEQLHAKGIITQAEYEQFLSKEASSTATIITTKLAVQNANGSINILESSRENDADSNQKNDEIRDLVSSLTMSGFRCQIQWIQALLLEGCYVKLSASKSRERLEDGQEPIPYYFNALGQSIPVVPYNEKQEIALNSKPFMEMLHKIGFHMPQDVGRVYPRIPCFFTADMLFNLAQKLGPIQSSKLKFSVERLAVPQEP